MPLSSGKVCQRPYLVIFPYSYFAFNFCGRGGLYFFFFFLSFLCKCAECVLQRARYHNPSKPLGTSPRRAIGSVSSFYISYRAYQLTQAAHSFGSGRTDGQGADGNADADGYSISSVLLIGSLRVAFGTGGITCRWSHTLTFCAQRCSHKTKEEKHHSPCPSCAKL